MNVTVCFVCDIQCDRKSASPEVARLMVRSVRLHEPTWRIRCGLVGGDAPDWLEAEKIAPYPIELLDAELRFANKLATIRACAGEGEGYTLFLDGDVLLLKPLDVELVGQVVGVHSDYPNPSTADWFGKRIYAVCEERFPTERMQCTMYGGKTWPTMNVGVVFMKNDIVRQLIDKWILNFQRIKSLPNLGYCKTFSEQVALMPAIKSLGLTPQWLSAEYNWNGTITPSTDRVVFLHYHRPDILSSDPSAVALLEKINKE